jgi:diacylglycerol O-acyltransferase / wax synthase
MPANRLSALDAAFIAVETPSAHMHVGWAAVFSPPETGPTPRFEELRDHVARRVPRAPRYRQQLKGVPLDVHNPEWVDDPDFDVGRHVIHSGAETLSKAVDDAMSKPLPRDRPLWQLHIADRLADGSVGVVGKAHHCMVDGIAAVELASLLVDPEPDPPEPEPDRWEPAEPPDPPELLVRGLVDRVREQLELAAYSARIATSPSRLLALPGAAVRGAWALADSIRPARTSPTLNEPISPLRHLALVERPLDDLRRIKRAFGVTINDVLLAASAGAVRRFLGSGGEGSLRLKAMVPVSVRAENGGDELGNRISFMFVDLPCDEAEPQRRLEWIHRETRVRKEAGEPEAADALLRLVAYAPRTLQHAISRLMASPRTFNLVVSNIPGPREPLYMRGCELRCAFPVVPIADRHALAIGFTTVRDRACFGLYADRESLPNSDGLADEIDKELDLLLELAENGRTEKMRDMVRA